jgi:hypothetical protein
VFLGLNFYPHPILEMDRPHRKVWEKIIAYEKEVKELSDKYWDKKTSVEAKEIYWNRIQMIKDVFLRDLDKKFGEENPTVD